MVSTKLIYLVVNDGENILDNRTSQLLGLVTIINEVSSIKTNTKGEKHRTTHPRLFRKEIGKYNVKELKLNINYDIKPEIIKHDRIPIYQRPLVAAECKNLMEQDIIERVPSGSATTYLSPVVVVTKSDGSIRLAFNTKKANKALIRERYPMATVDDIRLRIKGAKHITKLDMRKAYSQMVIREEDRHMTAFLTHEGAFRSKRLANGMNPCAELF